MKGKKGYETLFLCFLFTAVILQPKQKKQQMKTVNITALGDSLTKGVVLNNENRYSILKGSFIDIISDKLNLCIKNYAKFGCTIGFGHNVIDRHSSDISGYNRNSQYQNQNYRQRENRNRVKMGTHQR